MTEASTLEVQPLDEAKRNPGRGDEGFPGFHLGYDAALKGSGKISSTSGSLPPVGLAAPRSSAAVLVESVDA